MPHTVISTKSVSGLVSQNHRSERRAFAERLSYLAFLGDTIVGVAMLFLAYGLRFETPMVNLGKFDYAINLQVYMGHIFFGISMLLVLLVNNRCYSLPRVLSYTEGATSIAKVCLIWFLTFLGLSLILNIRPGISRLYCLVAAFQIMVGLLTWRMLFARILQKEAFASKVRGRLLFVGWNDDCKKVADVVLQRAAHPYEIVGVVPPRDGFSGTLPDLHIRDAGNMEELREILTKDEVDVVFTTDSAVPKEDLVWLADICVREMVELKIVPSYFQILLSGLHLESMSGVPVLGVTALPLHSLWNQAAKRIVDLVGALVGLTVSLPLMAIFGLLVKLESPKGPIFYRQVRVGRNGKNFYIYKLRSMHTDSESDGKARWANSGDDRCLRVGGFMRRWNIDEVPQFWNVLKGEMSLVGPRPERPEFIHDFREVIPHYNARHSCKPGITGWAQVNGLRGNTDLTERIQYDLYYIENWNPLLDFQIMLLTFIKRDNAY